MDYILTSETFLINERNEEIVTSDKMSKYSPEELRGYFDCEIVIATFKNKEGDIYTTFEIDDYNIEGMELKLPLYCGDKASLVEDYMKCNILVNEWLGDTVLDLCVEQSDNVLLSRALEVVREYPEEIIGLNETEYFCYNELHKALMVSNSLYGKCLDYYMEDYSVFQIEELKSPYIKDQKSFYEKLEEKAINVVNHEGKYQYNMYTGDLEYILFTNLDYQKVLKDINFNQKPVVIGNIELILENLEVMLNAFLHNMDAKKHAIVPSEEKVLIELNHILDDIQCVEEE